MTETAVGDAAGDLFERCRRGETDAYTEAYRTYGGALYGTALRMTGRPDEAEDVVQETFLKLFRLAAELRIDNLGGWLHRVTVNACLDRLRARGRRGEVGLEERLAGAVRAHASGRRVDLERALETLPERARLVFLLHDVEGFKHREVAELLDIADGTSKSQLFRAREMLREALQG